MNMNAELSASFLSGMVDVGGSGRYLTGKRESNRILQGSLHYNITTVHENLNFMSSELQELLAVNTLQSGAATHVVVGITWGAKSVVPAKYRLTTTEDQSEIEGVFHAKFDKLASPIKVDGNANLDLESDKSDREMSLEISVYGYVLATDGTMPTDFSSAYKFIGNVPKYIMSANGGKGKSLGYYLLPLSVLAFFLSIEISVGSALEDLSVECLARFVQIFGDMRETQRELHDYISDIKRHTNCVSIEHIKIVERKYNAGIATESSLKSKYASPLKEVRCGLAGTDQLQCFTSPSLGKSPS